MKMKAGEVVQMRSGGPLMTVAAVDGANARCLYFVEQIGEFKEASLPLAALTVVDLEDEIEDDD
jgi:uncharacterized protein YodC (DUF2158 family)